MRTYLQHLETEPFAAEREWTVDGIPVLSATLSLPRPTDRSNRIARRIDRFYQLQGRAYLRYCESQLFPQAAEEYRLALSASAPLPHYTAQLTYRITCSEKGIWSLYTDTQEMTGRRKEILRHGDTWDLHTGYPMPLSAFFPRHFPIRKTLLSQAGAEIARSEKAGVAQYHEHWRQQLRRTFNRENFYIFPEKLCYFWQMHAIAPPAEGLPTFECPFAPDGCHWPGIIAE